MPKKVTQHYVDNKKFLEAMVAYKDKVNNAKENNITEANSAIDRAIELNPSKENTKIKIFF